MKVIFMGTPDFSVGALEAIIQAGHQVTAVVTQPDKAKGRKKEVQMTPVKECALKYDIPVFQPVKIKLPEAVEKLKTFEADIFIVAAFGQILSEEILNMPKYGCINIHASLLPKYRGAAPIQWVILNGEKETGITIMQLDKGVDTGDMLMRQTVVIDERETGDSLRDKLGEVGAELIVKALPLIEKGELSPKKQEDSEATYFTVLDKSLGCIDWEKDAKSIDRLVRGLNSWPSAYTYYNNKTLKIWEAYAQDCDSTGQAGTVSKVDKDSFYINTGKNQLKVTQVQLEGKKRMNVKEFLLGNPLSEGTFFSKDTKS